MVAGLLSFAFVASPRASGRRRFLPQTPRDHEPPSRGGRPPLPLPPPRLVSLLSAPIGVTRSAKGALLPGYAIVQTVLRGLECLCSQNQRKCFNLDVLLFYLKKKIHLFKFERSRFQSKLYFCISHLELVLRHFPYFRLLSARPIGSLQDVRRRAG